MSLAAHLVRDLEQEAEKTRKMLAVVPDAKLAWKPHAKSMSLGELASHLAENPSWTSAMLEDEMDFAGMGNYKPYVAKDRADLLATFDKNVSAGLDAIRERSDEFLLRTWTMRSGDKVLMQAPKHAALRGTAIHHWIHHRGQLSVYLRLLDVPLPQVYGPTADDAAFACRSSGSSLVRAVERPLQFSASAARSSPELRRPPSSAMRRADRLFQIVQLLRGRKLVTAAYLARELEVSPRTVYRDVADLIASGVPIEGEAGVGYLLARGFDLPPLMFDADEIGALVLGARMVEAHGDENLARRARSVLSKVEAVVPEKLRKSFARPEWKVLPRWRKESRAPVEHVRRGIDERRKLRFRYLDEKGSETTRTVRPLCLAFWGPVWTAGAWCELRADFRSFRPDRMREVALLDERFADEPGKDLATYLHVLEEEFRRERGPAPSA